MKDLIVVCPTCDRAKIEFDRFLEFFGDIIVKRSNRFRRMITLKSGGHITFMPDKGYPVISNNFHVCSLSEFRQILKDIIEELKEKEKNDNRKES